jgi:hypothetical protein
MLLHVFSIHFFGEYFGSSGSQCLRRDAATAKMLEDNLDHGCFATKRRRFSESADILRFQCYRLACMGYIGWLCLAFIRIASHYGYLSGPYKCARYNDSACGSCSSRFATFGTVCPESSC